MFGNILADTYNGGSAKKWTDEFQKYNQAKGTAIKLIFAITIRAYLPYEQLGVDGYSYLDVDAGLLSIRINNREFDVPQKQKIVAA